MADIAKLEQIANQIRALALKSIHTAKSGHPGGCLSVADILAVLYFEIMQEDDKLILSKGHAAPAQYAALHLLGHLTKKELMSLRKLGSKTQGHPARVWIPEVVTSTGSLGHGLPFGVGLALLLKRQEKDGHIYVILGDGDLQEGSTVEAARLASMWQLNNLTAICDRNKMTSDQHSIDPIRDARKEFNAYGWWAEYCDGHNLSQIIATLRYTRKKAPRPMFLEAITTKGKGVSFMENDLNGYHGSLVLSDKELKEALNELGSD